LLFNLKSIKKQFLFFDVSGDNQHDNDISSHVFWLDFLGCFFVKANTLAFISAKTQLKSHELK